MRKTLILPSLLYCLLFIGCSHCRKCANSEEQLSDSLSYIHKESLFNECNYRHLDTTESERFQTFYEFKMQGQGSAKEFPFVYVWRINDTIVVKSSSERDSLRVYFKVGKDMWYSHMEYDMHKKESQNLLKERWERMARTYDRYFFNDTILEICNSFYKEKVYREIYVKSGKGLFIIGSHDELELPDNLMKKRDIIKQWTNDYEKYGIKRYTLEQHNGIYSYKAMQQDDNMQFDYEEKAYGFWGLQPGVNETNMLDGQDIRNFSIAHPNGMPDKKDETKVYDYADEMPEFPGGTDKLKDFIRKELSCMDGIDKYKGRVVVGFIVEKDGSLSDIKVVKSLNSACDNAALRIIGLMPKWKPASLCGEKVRCKYLIPINFNN